MASTLVVPLRINALRLTEDELVANPTADFTRLPSFDGQQDVNSDIANISEEILSSPGDPPALLLKAGIHIHWALPATLSKATREGQQSVFPAVPNRWLVTKRDQRDQSETRWVLESDYLYPEGEGLENGAVSLPAPRAMRGAKNQPYRLLGRKIAFENWPLSSEQNPPQLKLTAIGWGHPTFAAFYPNCHSVFGVHDATLYADDELPQIEYEVAGWYSREEDDYLFRLAADLTKDPAPDIGLLQFLRDSTAWDPKLIVSRARLGALATAINVTLTDELWLQLHTAGWLGVVDPSDADNAFVRPKRDRIAQRLAASFGGQQDPIGNVLEQAVRENFPRRLICYGAVGFPTSTIIPLQSPLTITLGNTGTEALSAFLATRIDVDNKRIIEDQLEALQLSDKLEHLALDVGRKFVEARHEKGFRALPGGALWEIRMAAAVSADSGGGQEVTLPEELAHQLNALNQAQQEYHDNRFRIGSIRRQIFSDWYKFMLCAYPPEDVPGPYPDPDLVKLFIERGSLAALAAAETATGLITVTGGTATAGNSSSDSLASRLMQSLGTLVASMGAANIASATLSPGDVKDWKAVAAGLSIASGNTPSALRSSIVLALPTGVRAAFDSVSTGGGTLDDAQIAAAIAGLNAFILSTDRFSQQDLSAIVLAEDVRELIALQPGTRSPEQAARLNRRVLEALLRDALRPSLQLSLKQIPAPRFWRPSEPAVMIEGELARATDRHDPKVIAGQVLDDFGFLTARTQDSVRASYTQLRTQLVNRKAADVTLQIGKPWNPILLDWEVEFFPIGIGDTAEARQDAFEPSFLSDNYALAIDGPDYTLKGGPERASKGANVYRGSSILTPHALLNMQATLNQYLRQELTREGLLTTQVGAVAPPELSPIDIQSLQAAYEAKHFHDASGANVATPATQAADPIYTALRAAAKLSNFKGVSQTLGGFNDGLLMHKQTFQLTPGDPLAFDEYRGFTEDVISKAVDGFTDVAPVPIFDFNPIRAGFLQLLNLRLVDTFGQVSILRVDRAVAADPLPIAEFSTATLLPPRFVQPARLSFRWLSASHEDVEVNSHPATTPICGWFLPNNLDDSVMVYSADGDALGSILAIEEPTQPALARWEPSPGGGGARNAGEVSQPRLKNAIDYIRAQGPAFVFSWFKTLEAAADLIHPDTSTGHDSLAVLMGNPLALVRATVQLELRDEPAVHQGWNVFRRDLDRNTRDTREFEDVKVPVRIGERQQLNDGVAGYWLESDDGIPVASSFLCPQFQDIESEQLNPKIQFLGQESAHLAVALDDNPVTLSMLMDPRCVAHATSGVLPTKSLSIPTDQYAPALKKIAITFRCGPVLTDPAQFQLPLATEPGREWCWIEKARVGWLQKSVHGIIRKRLVVDSFPNGDTIWTLLLQENWLAAIDASQASVVPKDKRLTQDLGAELADAIAAIEVLLSSALLYPVDDQAKFGAQRSLRTGWLKLIPSADNQAATS